MNGFDDLIRRRIAAAVGQTWRSIQREILESWLDLDGGEFERFVAAVGFRLQDDLVVVPLNKENEAKGTITRENVKFERKC